METLLDLDRIGEAEPINEQIVKANPADPRGLLSQGRILLSQRQYDKAKAALEGAVKSEPNSAASRYFLGLAQQAVGLPDMARVSFSKALELQPQMAQASAALASLTVKSGNNDEALRLAENARRANPNLPSAYLASGQALMAKGDLRQAESALQNTLQRDPVSLTALAALLKLYGQEGRMQEGLQQNYRLGSAISPECRPSFPAGLSLFQPKGPGEVGSLHQARARARSPNTGRLHLACRHSSRQRGD